MNISQLLNCFLILKYSIATLSFPMVASKSHRSLLKGFFQTPCNKCPIVKKELLISKLRVSGGAEIESEGSSGVHTTSSRKFKIGIASSWAVLSVLSILNNAIKRLAPVAMQPFKDGGFTNFDWIMYVGCAMMMAYVEGYKAFQKKFSPMVVQRALVLDEDRGFLRLIFAGPYSMGLFHASKKRKIVSWVLTFSVFGLVQIVKRLPYPWRSIIDAGVVAGLSWGSISILYYWIRSWFGRNPGVDPQLPEKKTEETL